MSIILHSDGLLGKIAGRVYWEQVNLAYGYFAEFITTVSYWPRF